MYELPEVNFLETDPQFYIDEQVKEYEVITNRKLAIADPVYLLFKAVAYSRTKHAIRTNDALRQQLLFYSRDGVLDHKGSQWDTPRIGGDKAKVTMRFFLEEGRIGIAFIKKGSIVTPNGDLLFKTTYDAVASDDQTSIDVVAECEKIGVIGNDFEPGKINELLNPIQYVRSCTNVTTSAGGTEIELDEAYRQRIQAAPEKMSTAGSEEGYKFYTYAASPLITDVDPYMPEPGYVNVRFLLAGGEIPGEEMLEKVREALSDKKVRPLTDNLSVSAPEIVEYNINGKYYISKNTPDVDAVKNKIEKAKSDFIYWQSEKMGRDINPSKLIEMCVKAGAKRLDLTSPVFTIIERGQVAKVSLNELEFGGIEDD
ncbi:baseplate protein [Lysinibacillus alkalisoli]|uniref:Baseplate protein n=1 Tax=Lysinibacillus alkalisoli TaxID=1911548 RepID=A0A917GAJ7_9BACI|nr:baseplate J/gp47 family protein [Lysinibacillus alkalisoli]GGG33004.1 baseplate protein [Lysinibacillus alkalisoli]